MKKGINILTFGFALATLTGCGDFLTQEAQDLVIPKTVTQYKELLQGDGYFKNLQTKAAWVHFLTDDMATGPYEYADDPTKISSYMEKYKQIFLWQAEIESDQFTDDLYAYLYNQALPGTICLEMLDDMEGSDTEKRILKGQASFQRAMAFFYLANLYGPAYNEAQGSDPCVPMSLTATATPGSYPRKTVEEVWGQIHTDITTAVECLDGYEAGVYEINYKAALLLASRVALFMENYEEAITYAERLLELAPTLFDMVGKIDIETYLQHPDSVEKYVGKALELFPDKVDFHISKGHVMNSSKQYGQAVKAYKESLRYADTDSLRGVIWGMIGDTWHQQAAAGISEQDESRTAKEGRSGPYRKAMKECYKAYERSLAYRPDNPLVLNNYAYFLSLEERDLERALSMSSRVVALTDNNPTYLDTHAWVLFKLGRTDEAKKVLQKAVALDGQKSPELMVHYGDILHELGEQFMAEIYWKRALEKGYDARQIELRLKQPAKSSKTAE